MFKGDSTLPLADCDAAPNLFKLYKDNMEDDDCKGNTFTEWKKDMKLEVLDPLDNWKELRVGTVMELLDDGYLKVSSDFHFFFQIFSKGTFLMRI